LTVVAVVVVVVAYIVTLELNPNVGIPTLYEQHFEYSTINLAFGVYKT